MSSLTKVSSKNLQGLPQNTIVANKTTTTPVKNTELSSAPAFAAPDHSSEKTFSAQARPIAPAKARTFTYFGGITEGHYTEF
jgi:hypothetical protein